MFEQLLEGPTSEPVTVVEQATWSRFDAPDEMVGSPAEDNPEYLLVQSQIAGAREQIERQTHYCYLSQTWQLTLDVFPKIYIGLDMYGRHWHIPAPWPFR